MQSRQAPDEHVCEAVAATVQYDQPSPGYVTPATAAVPLHVPSNNAVLQELSHFIERVSVEGVRTPVDHALLAGAKQVFESLLTVCEQLADPPESVVTSSHGPPDFGAGDPEMPGFAPAELSREVRAMAEIQDALASAGPDDDEPLESFGPDDVDESERSRTSAASVPQKAKKKARKKPARKRTAKKS